MPPTDAQEPASRPNIRRPKSASRKRRGCLWSLLIGLLVGLPLLLWILNGPGFRFLANYAILKAAESRNLEGNLTIDGDLWSGFSLSSVDFTGDDGTVASLEIEDASIGYRLPKLVRGRSELDWIDELNINKATLKLNLPDPDDEPIRESEKPGARDPTDFSPLWNLLETNVDISELTLLAEQGDRVYLLGNLSLRSEPGERGKLTIEEVQLPGRRTVTDISADLVKGEHSLTIESFRLGDVASLKQLTVAEPRPGQFVTTAEIDFAEGTLNAEFDNAGVLSVALSPGSTLDLAGIIPTAPDRPEARGTVTDLSFRFEGAFDDPSTWEIEGNLAASGLVREGVEVDTVVLAIQDNTVELEVVQGDAEPPATLHASLSLPLDRTTTVDELATLPIGLDATFASDSLESLLGDRAETVPLTGALSVEVKDVQIVAGSTIQSGSFLALSDSLAWDGTPVETFQIAGSVETENLLRIAADVGLDADNSVRLSGTLDTESLSYEAQANGTIASEGPVEDLMAARGIEAVHGAATFSWEGSGDLRTAVHRGEAEVDATSIRLAEGQPFDGTVAAVYEGDSVELSSLRLTSGDVVLAGSGTWQDERISLSGVSLTSGGREKLSLDASLPFDPAAEGGFLAHPGPLELNLSADELRPDEITRFFRNSPPVAGILTGRLSGEGTFRNLSVDGDFQFRPEFEGATESSLLSLTLDLQGDAARPATWETTIDGDLSDLRWKDVDIGKIAISASTESTGTGKAILADLNADQSGAKLEGTLRLDLEGAESFAALGERPLEIDADLDASQLETLWRDFAPTEFREFPVSGALSAQVEGLRLESGRLTRGRIDLVSESLALDGETFDNIAVDAEVTAPDLLRANIDLALDEANQASGAVEFHLKERTYEGELSLAANLQSEGKLKRLLGERRIAALLPQLTSLTWSGKGDPGEGTHQGELDLKADSLTLADGGAPIDLAVSGEYSETSADFPTVSLASRPLALEGALRWTDHRLVLNDWTGRVGGREVLSLDGTVPLDRGKLSAEAWFAQSTPLELTLTVDELSTATVFELLGREPPVRGDLSFDVAAEGTPATPTIEAELTFADIVVPREDSSLEAGRLELSFRAANASAGFDGTFRHPDVNPLAIEASMPFHPGAWATGERKVLDEPVSASAKMEKSNLAFLSSQVPAVASISGTVGLDATVGGTLSKPEIGGSGLLEVDRLRLENRDAPSFYDIDLQARFADDRIAVDRFRAIVAGGIVEGGGSVLFEPGKEPVLEVQATGSEVLVLRTPDMNVRTDAALTLTGPFSEARLAGELGITNSRFFKHVDLLPIGLPTRRRSALPTVERVPGGGGAPVADLDVGVPIPPFDNWPIDVRIYTKDPFLVRGNLAQSALVADLRVGGTLGEPVPNGYLAIDEGEFSLPFSSVDVEVGRIEFDANTGFNGAIEFKARARADSYRINIYVYDRILSPKHVLSSVPPLPSEDIITLLATGTTRDELLGADAGSLAASKAATLLFRKMRKAGDADRDPSLLDELQERTELEIGGINPETGEQTFGGRIRLWKQLFFVGDVDADSDYRALLKYVFRFR
ncbi:MAG: translocation/assembly module TamB domain-containing protein [Verrucomicrobiales bacterium]